MGDLSRFGLKLFLGAGSDLDAATCIPVFHRWIQSAALDRLLIDVADYTHLVDGPSVLLVAHEGNLAVDTTAGRPGLLCTRKQPGLDSLAERLAEVARTLLTAAQLLESESTFKDRVTFDTGKFQFVSSDRLIAPPDAAAFESVEPRLRELLEQLYPEQPATIAADPEARDRLTIQCGVPSADPLPVLLQRAAQTVSSK